MESSRTRGSKVVLFSCEGNASLYMIPPRREGARGHMSGTWRHEDCIFTGSCMVEKNIVIDGDDEDVCVIRLVDQETRSLFALCRVPPAETHDSWMTVVEPVCDSSRMFVIRVEDPETTRHAFLGLSFEERSVAMDFRMALAEESRRGVNRKRMSTSASSSTGSHRNLSLKEGDMLHIDAKKMTARTAPLVTDGGGFVSSRVPPRLPDDAYKGGGKHGAGSGDVVVATETSTWETFT